MAIVTNKPEDLPSSNDLDHVHDPDEATGGERAEIYLSGAHVCTLDNAPGGLGRITLMADVEVYEVGVRYTGEDGEVQMPIRKCRRIGDMYLPGTQRPPSKEEARAMAAAAKAQAAREQAEREEAERAEAEQNEPPMFDEDGNPASDDAPRPPADDEEDQGDTEPGPDENVVAFSDSKPKK